MKNKSVLIVGCGDLGTRAGLRLASAGWAVTGLRRDIGQLPVAFKGLAANYAAANADLSALQALAPDFVLLTLKPAGSGEAGYRAGFSDAVGAVLRGLGSHRPAGILMVSSTRVYAEADGGWVEDDSPLVTTDPAAGAIIDAEQQLFDSPHPACTVRSAGIYGDPEGFLLRRVARGELCAASPVRYSNRIHREDVGGLLAWLLQRWAQGIAPAPRIIAVDNDPAPQFEVEAWLARALGLDAWQTGASTPRSVAHKRCRNRALTASGYRLRYPDYRSGYSAVLQARVTSAKT